MGELFVTLHLPLPVMRSFLPIFAFRSNIVTDFPYLAANTAAMQPAAPAPIITASVIGITHKPSETACGFFAPFSRFCGIYNIYSAAKFDNVALRSVGRKFTALYIDHAAFCFNNGIFALESVNYHKYSPFIVYTPLLPFGADRKFLAVGSYSDRSA